MRPTRPAASKRSPNRKPRYRSVVKTELRVKEQETFLRAYLVAPLDADALEYAAGMVGRTKQTVMDWLMQWASKDTGAAIGFLSQWSELRERRKRLMEGRRQELDGVALGVVDATLTAEDAKLRYEAARDQLRGSGFWGSRQEVTGKDGEPIKIQTIEVVLHGKA